ncbi:MAG: 1-deoxy-D-xylulose-5-phosphate reductoisomerase [Bacilli bacterium]|nr:1-deoxy-D-xylulose-5-phosphate reductoisomerase [Bacilli bacterium]
MRRNVCLLGASGNIGEQALDLFEKDRERFNLVAVSVGFRVQNLPLLLSKFPSIRWIYVRKEEDASSLKEKFPNVVFYHGDDGLASLIRDCGADMVVNALVGFAGLVPSITALEENKILCLANKESLVVGGELIKKLLAKNHGVMYPIDSEHVAIAKCLSRVNRKDVDKLVITASGGSFRKLRRDELDNVTAEMALQHPTWRMGEKITIDSATMFNKGFEVIEAHYLFDWPIDQIKVLLHDESQVHSLLLMKDGSYWADVNKPDMHGPIEYAIYEGKSKFEVFHQKKIEDFGPYHYHEFDPERYPAVGIAVGALKESGIKPCVLNAANEEAVHLFLDGKIGFLDIERYVLMALEEITNIDEPNLDDLIRVNRMTREYVRRKAGLDQ